MKLTQHQALQKVCYESIDIRPELAGVYYENNTATATNSFALCHIKDYKIDYAEPTIIIHGTHVKNKSKIDVKVVGTYPQWQQIIPIKEDNVTSQVTKIELNNILECIVKTDKTVYINFNDVTVSYLNNSNNGIAFTPEYVKNVITFLLTDMSNQHHVDFTYSIENKNKPIMFETPQLLSIIMPKNV